jgi:opacity protein-like surface antigen
MVFAQTNEFEKGIKNNWQVGFNVGVLSYWGDVSSPKDLNNQLKYGTSWGYGVSLSKQITPIWGIQGNILLGNLNATKPFYNDGVTPLNLKFQSKLIEGNLNATINLTNLIYGYKPNRMVNAYGIIGLGLGNFEGQTTYLTGGLKRAFGYGSGKGINGYEIDGIGNIGFGVNLKLKKQLFLKVETTMKFTPNDTLDGVHAGLNSDFYNFTSVGLIYKFSVGSGKKSNLAKADKLKANLIDKNGIKKPVFQDKPTETKPTEVKKTSNAPAPEKVDVKITPFEQSKKDKENEEAKNEFAKNEASKRVQDIESVKIGDYSGYKVQILATQKSVTVAQVKRLYHISSDVRLDIDGGWHRFSVGTFSTFKAAHIYAKQLMLKHRIHGAFVVLFRDGIRVGAATMKR